jgi:hypothetical protein
MGDTTTHNNGKGQHGDMRHDDGGSTATSGTTTLQNEGNGRHNEMARRSTLY